MPTTRSITSRDSAYTEILQIGNKLTVTAPAGSTAKVKRFSLLPDTASTDTNVVGETKTFGPYQHDLRFQVDALVGSATISEDIAEGLEIGSSASSTLKAPNAAARWLLNSTASDGNGSAPGKTYCMKMALPLNVLAIRPIFSNHFTSDITGVKVIASSAADPAENFNNAGTWTAGTFAGASTGTLKAGVAASNPTLTRSDWIPVVPIVRNDGGASTIYHVRAFIPSANATVPIVGTNGPVEASTVWYNIPNQEWRCSVNVGDFVAAPGTYTEAGTGNSPIVAFEYLVATTAGTVAAFGDSIAMGFKATIVARSSVVLAGESRSTAAKPISVQNLAVGGTTTGYAATLAEAIIPVQKPVIAFFGGFSPNDGTPTAATIQTQKINMARFLKVCRDNGTQPVLMTAAPNTNNANTASTYSAVVDDLVKGLNDHIRTLCAAGYAILVDSSKVWSDAETPGIARLWKAGYLAAGDGLHPGDTAYTALTTDPAYGTLAALSKVL